MIGFSYVIQGEFEQKFLNNFQIIQSTVHLELFLLEPHLSAQVSSYSFLHGCDPTPNISCLHLSFIIIIIVVFIWHRNKNP